jgi:hypothetical protein
MIDHQEIESFLQGNDPEQHIVAIEYDYRDNVIYKIKEIPGKGKVIQKDNFIAFAWVGDLKDCNFYKGSSDGVGLERIEPTPHLFGTFSFAPDMNIKSKNTKQISLTNYNEYGRNTSMRWKNMIN